ncbi:hypothetical protein ABEB36_008881 [Hypothenemus hampei]|uniref:Uncharacterized protein n=1 Tax=Hypothenemus hampei TaxID=57062 RepID=A0ABD1ENE0_HYPHA
MCKKEFGDCEATLINNRSTKFSGNIFIMKTEGDDRIVVSHEGINVIILSCSVIRSYNVTEKIITCQFREDYFAQKLVIKFFGNDQVKTFLSALPPILRPTPEEDISRR